MKLEEITENTIIICENSYKKAILNYIASKNVFCHVKFFTKKEFWQEYLFKFDEKALYYLVSKYNLKISIAKMYLNNLYYLPTSNNENPKLNFLSKIKNELAEQKLLIYNPLFKNYIQNYQIIVMGYSFLEKWEEEKFKSLNVKIIKKETTNKKFIIREAASIEEEVSYVAQSIAKLLDDGISINNIKLMNVNDSYYNIIKRIFNFYHIPIKIPSQNTLYNNVIGQKFLNNLTSDLNETLQIIKEDNEDIYNKIINICNKYVFITDLKCLKKFLTYEFKNTIITDFNLNNYVDILNIEDYISDDDFIFLMSFNSDSIPKYYRDEDYLTDNIKDIPKYDTITKNKIIKENILKILANINNLVITYKKSDGHKECYISSLNNELDSVIEKIDIKLDKSYAKILSKLEYAKCLYNYYTYGVVSEDLLIYQNSISDLEENYNTFDNTFKGIDNNNLLKYLNNRLTLSYSALNNYNRCAFRYYLENILQIDPFVESFDTFIGSLFHDVLEKCLNNNLDIDIEIKNYLQKYNKEFTFKERFYLNKIIAEIKFAFNVIRSQNAYIGLDKHLYEKKIIIDKSREINIYFKGIIDKILYKEEDGKTYIAIIDYKSGSINTELKYLPYGLSLQLPIYLYLVKKSELFKNPYFAGFYLQHVLNNTSIVKNNSNTYLEQKEASLKLEGYSNSNINTLAKFDNSFASSKLIRGMKLKNDGNFYTNAKILSDAAINKVIELTEKNIDDAINNIIKGDFPINPKKIGVDKYIGCEYCKFKDICFRRENNYVKLPEIANLDFLGGDSNAEMD